MIALSGVCTALVTPFSNGKVDLDTLTTLVERQIQSGVHGLVPCGTTGETPTLNSDEWAAVIRTTIEVNQGRVPVIAGCGTNSTRQTVDNIKAAKALGADAALVVFPYYNKPNPAGLQAHVNAACAEGLPVVLYHVPGRTGQRLTADMLEQLCRTPGVVALKEATGDVTLGQTLCNRLNGTNVALLSGDDFTYAAAVAMGFAGVISVLSNPAPKQSVAWFEAARTGDIEALRSLRQQLLPVVEALFASTNPIPCKGMMAGLGLLENACRLPLIAEAIPSKAIWDGLN